MPRGRGRGRGRPRIHPRKEDIEVSDASINDASEELVSDGDKTDDNLRNDVNEDSDGAIDEDTSRTSISDGPRKRGRKRKAEIPREERYVPSEDPAKRGIAAQGGSLRRRDTIKSGWRYSPPPVSTRRSKTASSTPSRYMDELDFNKSYETAGPLKRRLSATRNSVTEVDNLEYVKTDDKLIVTLPDGSNLKVIVCYYSFVLIQISIIVG